MTGWNFVHKAVLYQKTATDNSFEIFSILQNSSKEMLEQSLAGCSWLPEQSKEGYLQWVSGCVAATDNLKKLIDGGYRQLELQFSEDVEERAEPAEKPAVATPSELKPAATKKAAAAKPKAPAARKTRKTRAKASSTETATAGRKAVSPAAARPGRKKTTAAETKAPAAPSVKVAAEKKQSSEVNSAPGAAASAKQPMAKSVNAAPPVVAEEKKVPAVVPAAVAPATDSAGDKQGSGSKPS